MTTAVKMTIWMVLRYEDDRVFTFIQQIFSIQRVMPKIEDPVRQKDNGGHIIRRKDAGNTKTRGE
jgi:hypothetical protein